MFSEEKNFEEL